MNFLRSIDDQMIGHPKKKKPGAGLGKRKAALVEVMQKLRIIKAETEAFAREQNLRSNPRLVRAWRQANDALQLLEMVMLP